MIVFVPITEDFKTNAKNCGTIKIFFCFLMLIIQFCWSSSKMVRMIASPILMIWKIFTLKKVLQSLVQVQVGFLSGFCRKLSTPSFPLFTKSLPLSLNRCCHFYGKLEISNGIVNNCFHCTKLCNCWYWSIP